MSEKYKIPKALWIVTIILALIVGGFITYGAFPRTVTEIEIEKEEFNYDVFMSLCPVCEICEICEVCPEPEITEKDYLGEAVSDFMEYIEDEGEEEGYWECGDWLYDFDQISVRKVYDNWNQEWDNKDYTIDFEIKLRYLDKDFEEKCYNNFDVSIFYELDEDPVISVFE